MARRAGFAIPDHPPGRPNVPEVAERILDYYRRPGNGAGGSLHVVIEDGNVGVGIIRAVLADAIRADDLVAAGILGRMLCMSPTQRRKLAARSYYPRT